MGELREYPELSPPAFLFLQIIGFAVSGWMLLRFSDQPSRRALGVAYCLISSSFAYGVIYRNGSGAVSAAPEPLQNSS